MMIAVLALILGCYQFAEGANWALLVAGSNGYGNYRHQADVCHSYQLLRDRGFPSSNIVTMMYDDIAYSSKNPYKGNIINEPNGKNVYRGIKIDYRGRDVNAKNFLRVLQGQRYEMNGIGSGRTIRSGPRDHVFVYYADHGNKNLIGFPGGVLYSRDLNSAIKNMHRSNKYYKMVFYIEACFSGTMFYNRLPTNYNVYAITAANTRESSYSCYYDRARRTYLADEFSIRWIQDSVSHNANSHRLSDQFQNVRRLVRNSHVMNYGDTGMGSMVIGQFQGNVNLDTTMYASPAVPITDAVPTWDVPYMSLMHQLEDANSTEARMELLHEMQAEQMAQFKIRGTMQSIADRLSPNPALMMHAQETKTTEEQDHCYEQAVEKYLQSCTAFAGYDYAMKDLHVFANLCNKGASSESINEVIDEVCA